jgi:NCAIR mutase (PurE)-related protein
MTGEHPPQTRDEFQEAARQFRAGRIGLSEFTDRCFHREISGTIEATPASKDGEGLCLDFDRQRRCGFPEVIFGAGKSLSAIRESIEGLRRHDQPVLVTRVESAAGDALAQSYPDGSYHPRARTFRIGRCPMMLEAASAIVTAGTSDYGVAAEAAETLVWMGVDPELIQDVGVAGPDRLRVQLPKLKRCQVVIVVAGFEGALPSVVGGHLDCPVIGVPTTHGHSVGWQGVTPLLAMLNSCAPNVVVVNLDAGFKAGYLAGLILRAATCRSDEVPLVAATRPR